MNNDQSSLDELGLNDAELVRDPFGKALENYQSKPDEFVPSWIDSSQSETAIP